MVSLYGGYLACGPQAGRLAAAKIACGSMGLKKITPENFKNYKEIFDQLELSVRHTKGLKTIKRYFGIAKSIVGLASGLKSLS